MTSGGIAALRTEFAAPFVLVTGGKGGVGKTTLASNLALVCASRGQRTLLVDLDLALGDVEGVLGLAPQRSLEDALGGLCPLSDCVHIGPAGLHVLTAPNGEAALAQLDVDRRERFLAELAALSSRYDIVFGDSAAGIGSDVLAFAACASMVLVVTTSDPSAATDAFGLIKALEFAAREHHVEIPTPELVLNLVTGVQEAEHTARQLAEVCRRFLSRSPRLAGWMPRSQRIVTAARRRANFALSTDKQGAATLERDCLDRLARRVFLACGVHDAGPCVSRDGKTFAAQGSRKP